MEIGLQVLHANLRPNMSNLHMDTSRKNEILLRTGFVLSLSLSLMPSLYKVAGDNLLILGIDNV